MGEGSPVNRRRSQRVLLQLAVLIRWDADTGKQVHSQAFTVMVNAHGGLLEASARMKVGQRLILVNPQTKKEAVSRVVSVEHGTEGNYRTAFEFEERSPRFWPIAFPPLDWEAPPEAA